MNWTEYEASLREALAALPAALVNARVKVAYNRMHGITNTPEQLRAAWGESAAGEWPTGSTGGEVL